MKAPSYVYILGNARPTLYIGVTTDLLQRVYQHREEVVEGFSARYGLTKLLHFEEHSSIMEAITREKQLKKWNREWKLRLIRESNPNLDDLYPSLTDSRLRGNDVGSARKMTKEGRKC